MRRSSKLVAVRVALSALAAVWLLGATVPTVAAASSRGGTRAIPTNVDTSVRAGNEAEQTIAINPTNPRNVVVMSTLPDVVSGLFEGYSFDGGKTWTKQVIANGGPLGTACCDEALSWDSFGNLWLTYLYTTSGTVPVAVSTDGGKTFTLVTNVQPTLQGRTRGPRPATKGTRFWSRAASSDQPSIATGAGSVWITYTSEPSVVVQAAGAPVTGLGVYGSFGAPQSVPTTTGKGDYGDIAIGPSGQVLVIYQFPTGGETGSKVYTSLDADGLGAGGFATPRLLASSKVGGVDFIPAQAGRSIDAEANLAWDRSGGAHNGRVYAVWTQETPNESNNTDIMFQSSDDNGATWTTAVKVNTDTGTNSQFMQSIAVDQATGYVGLSWYDCRNDLGTGGSGDTNGVANDDAQIWGAFSRNGSTFTANRQLSAGTSNSADAGSVLDYGDYTHAAFQSHLFEPVWSDNSNSTANNPNGALHKLDILVTRVNVT